MAHAFAAAVLIAAALGLTSVRSHAAGAMSLGFEKYYLPTWSMAPTLLQHDYLVVFPISKPARGDVVAYRMPKDTTTIYLKRIVGLPGDKVQMVDGGLIVNGAAVARERVEDFGLSDDGGRTSLIRQWRETLPGGASYMTLDMIDNGFLDNTPAYSVPDGHYFVMGDNRDNSTDSRIVARHGTVPAENIVGRVSFIYFSMEAGETLWKPWRWPRSVRWNRIFTRPR